MVEKEKGDVWRYNRFAAHFCFRRETSGQTPQPKLTSSSNPGKLESTSRPSSATSQVRLPSPSTLTHRAGVLALPLLCSTSGKETSFSPHIVPIEEEELRGRGPAAARLLCAVPFRAGGYKCHGAAFYLYSNCMGFAWQMPPTVITQGSC